ncbi:hypothetical protein K7432_001197 [Basidiobolus ranarum]|uniref:Uncharacterized protein n=1 Tax=Basidiobolus ranarum TaxID=34480 RepID=A0ABR2X3F7_9FUNG
MSTTDDKQEVKRHNAIKAASEWNKLLLWARKARGPFYDPSTRMHQVDKGSGLYFSGVKVEDLNRDPGSPPSNNSNLTSIKPSGHQLAPAIGNKHLSKVRATSPARVGNRGRPKRMQIDSNASSATNTPGSVSSVLN